MINAPHPLKGINNLEGAEVESAIYANFSLDNFNLSNIGLKIVPTVKADILDSTKINIPVKAANN